jgi:hypothetical protein
MIPDQVRNDMTKILAQTKNLKHKQATKPYRHHKIALAKQQKRKTRTPQDFSKTSYQPNPIKGDFRSEAGMTYIKIHLNRQSSKF